MEDLASKLEFLEARLTLLERKFGKALIDWETTPGAVAELPPGPVTVTCGDPGLVISKMYPVERDSAGVDFCWMGNEGPIQILLPVRPVHPLTCVLKLRPHAKVDASELSVIVNDEAITASITPCGDLTIEVAFKVVASAATNINIILIGLKSVRPGELGENTDMRLLAARFYWATLNFIDDTEPDAAEGAPGQPAITAGSHGGGR